MRIFALLERAIIAVFDAVLPVRARTARTRDLQAEELPLEAVVHDLLGVHITTLMDYQNRSVADLIQSLKYDGSAYAAHLAATAIADYLREEIASHTSFSQKKVLIVPVPSHQSRVRDRGFNQIELALNALPAEFKNGTLSRLDPNVLIRARDTKQQTRLSRSERLSNVAGAFRIREDADVDRTQIYLIDDVTTTGATLANAATPLRRAGAQVTLLALARA